MGSIGGEEAIQDPPNHEERILVSVRLRPLNDKELTKNDVSDWECINDNTIIYRNNLPASERSLYPTAYSFGMKNTLIILYLIYQMCLLYFCWIIERIYVVRYKSGDIKSLHEVEDFSLVFTFRSKLILPRIQDHIFAYILFDEMCFLFSDLGCFLFGYR